MTLIATSRGTEVAWVLGAGLLATLGTIAAYALLARVQRDRIRTLGRLQLDPSRLSAAADEAERNRKGLIHQVLESAVTDVAIDQNLPRERVRAALFAPAPGGAFRIVDGQFVNFADSAEVFIGVKPGETGVGEAVESRSPVITVFQSPQEETTIADATERGLISRDLRWIISVPIAESDHLAAWVLTVDGLVESRTAEELRRSVARLLYYREILELMLTARGKRGGKSG